jgi:hypothetical protein
VNYVRGDEIQEQWVDEERQSTPLSSVEGEVIRAWLRFSEKHWTLKAM